MWFFSFYIIIRGSVSTLVNKINDSDTTGDIDMTQRRMKSSRASTGSSLRLLDNLGSETTILGPGRIFGEMVQSTGGMHQSSVVTNTPTDLLVIDRNLYHRSIERIQKADLREKNKFLDSLSIFAKWSQQSRSQLLAALQQGYHSGVLFKQGAVSSHVYFIRSGLVKLVVTHAKEKEAHEFAVRRRYRAQDGEKRDAEIGKRVQEISIVGHTDTVGDLEAVYDLPHYTCTAICLTDTNVYSIDKATFRFLFKQKNPETWETVSLLVSYKLLSRSPNLKAFSSFQQLLTLSKQVIESAEQTQQHRQLENKQRLKLKDAVRKKKIGGGGKPIGTGADLKPGIQPKPDVRDTDTFLTTTLQSDKDESANEEKSVCPISHPTSTSLFTSLTSNSTPGNDRISLPILLVEPLGGRWSSSFKAGLDMSNALHNTLREGTIKRLLRRLDQIRPSPKAIEEVDSLSSSNHKASLVPVCALGQVTLPKLAGKKKHDKDTYHGPTPVTPIRGYVQDRTRQGTAIFRTHLRPVLFPRLQIAVQQLKMGAQTHPRSVSKLQH
jgi:CRP-like cAMP-binding protein